MNPDQPLINVQNVLDNSFNDLILEDDDTESQTSTNEIYSAQWCYYHNHKWFQYNKVMNALIEDAYKTGKKRLEITPAPNLEYIDFTQMMAVCASAHIPNAVLKREEIGKATFPKLLPPLSKHVKTGLAMQVAHDIFNKALTYLDNHSPGMVEVAHDRMEKEEFIMNCLSECDNGNNATEEELKIPVEDTKFINIDKPIKGSLTECSGNETLNLAEILLHATEQNVADADEETVKLLEESKTDMNLLENITQYSAYENSGDEEMLFKSVI